MNDYQMPTDLPVIVNVSGGRTSAYLALKIAEHNPSVDNIVYLFQNTGREREETLEFVRDLSIYDGLNIVWVEYCGDAPFFKVVNFETASRWNNPKPFDDLIEKRKYLPNVVERFCTEELKVKTARRYLRSVGIRQLYSVIGFRADEPRRVDKLQKRVLQAVNKLLASAADNRKRTTEIPLTPLFQSGVTSHDVGKFWQNKNYDLKLPMLANGKTVGGNCVGCFLHAECDRAAVSREEPEKWQWLLEKEAQVGATFVKGVSAEELQKRANSDIVSEFGDDQVFCVTAYGGCHDA